MTASAQKWTPPADYVAPDLYQAVTDRIVASLEAGTVPWRCPWVSVAGQGEPHNLVSRAPYRGMNFWMLLLQAQDCGYATSAWCTFKQALDKGGSVRKGEKGTHILFWKPTARRVRDEATGEESNARGLLLRQYVVFNVAQCDGLTPPAPVAPPPTFDPEVEAERMLTGYVDGPTIAYGGNQACYRPMADTVSLPPRAQFRTANGFYATAFHELAHSTGHHTRLDRDGIQSVQPFGSPTYSKEELVAEFGSAYLLAVAGLANDLENSAAYVNGWLDALKHDKRLLIHGAAQAHHAADRILGRHAPRA